ncbi:hypothetical protein [Halocatena halophila]|uniref:hypothetical protein n=1 Tax=Halocatena halophila TaxID=2814576 RepID=UPI002ECFF380
MGTVLRPFVGVLVVVNHTRHTHAEGASDTRHKDTNRRPTERHRNPGALTPADSTNGTSEPPGLVGLDSEAHGEPADKLWAAIDMTKGVLFIGDDADGQEIKVKTLIHMIGRLIHRYRHKLGIENGFKKHKHFIGRTTQPK